jgi:hypothetical protein
VLLLGLPPVSLAQCFLFHILAKMMSQEFCGDPAHHCMCSVQVNDIILTKVPFYKYHIPQIGTIETLQVRNFTCS